MTTNLISTVSDPAAPPRSILRAPWGCWGWAAAAIALFLSLSIGFSITRAPWWDEGVFSDVALNFSKYGHFGSTVLDPHGYRNWPQVHQYTYWQFPGYLLVLGAWLHIVPSTIVWIRLFSVLWGCLYVYCWFQMVRCLTHDEPLALFIASIVALDYATVATASDGRMDMMCAASGQAALACFLCLKDRHWNRALFLAGCFGAVSLFSHPMGAIPNAVLALLVLPDWRRIRWQGILAVSFPYLLGAALCLLYISKAPEIFLAQTRAASGYRVSGLGALIWNILNDLYVRYGEMYITDLSGLNRLKGASLIFAVAGTVAVIANCRLRSHPLGRILLMLAIVGYLGVAAIDNQKFPIYFIYSMPAMSACGAFWVHDLWCNDQSRTRSPRRFIPAALLAASLLATIGGFSFKIYQNDFDRLYHPAVSAIQADLPPGGIVMGGSELGFAFGFGPHLIDDRFLGYASGIRPDVFVENGYYGTSGAAGQAAKMILRNQYRLTFENSAYKIYARDDHHSERNISK